MSLQSVLWGTDFICVYCSIPAALCWARGETFWKCSLKYSSLWSICGTRVSFIFLCTNWCLFNFLRGWNVIGISILLATLSAIRNEIRYSVIGYLYEEFWEISSKGINEKWVFSSSLRDLLSQSKFRSRSHS